jgi:hypothetical protein
MDVILDIHDSMVEEMCLAECGQSGINNAVEHKLNG